MKSFLLTCLLTYVLLLVASTAHTQQPTPLDPLVVQLQLEESQALLAQRRQQLVAMDKAMRELDESKKWVLDNWVPKK